MLKKRLDLVGEKCGRWTVIADVGNDRRGNSQFLCGCECGIERVVKGCSLKSGNTKSCGCYSREIASERCRSGKNHPAYGKKRPDTSKKMSGERNPMYGIRHFGKDNHMYGKKHSEETKQKISKTHIELELIKGENNPNWKGGITCEPYCEIWLDKGYKEDIKARDSYQCQNPFCNDNCKGYLFVHHIDYNKKNCHPSNLITLCNSCSSRANYNREYWTNLYQNIMIELGYKKE